jgi:PAS domain S-box-containing protein
MARTIEKPLCVLLIEDVEDDAQLVLLELGRGGYQVEWARVDTPAAMSNALAGDKQWDVVISDFSLKGFTALDAIRLVRDRQLDVPFIIVSGTIDEDRAIEALRMGAGDFMSKSRLARLVPAVGRELQNAAVRAEGRRAEQVNAAAQAETRAIHDQLDALLNCAPSLVLAVDRTGRIQFVNQVLPHLSKQDVIGADWLLYIASEDCAQMTARLRSVVETGQSLAYETSTLTPDGGRLWYASHMGAIRHGDAIVGAVIVANNVTETRVAQMEAAAAQRLAAIGTLAAGIAHEINTPVQFVGDSVEFLRTAAQDLLQAFAKFQVVHRLVQRNDAARPLPAELAEAIAEATRAEEDADIEYLRENVPAALERCSEGLGRVAAIVSAMKEFSHPAHSEMAPVDLNRAIQNTLAVARGEYKYVADLETDLGDLPPVVCHVNEINQVVLNLVVNAAHAIGDVVGGSEARGRITVRTRSDGEHVVISVADTGAGIPHAIRERIFTPFFTTKEIGKGTGQGLALAWNVIKERHRGELTFETEVGRGTTFFVRLPRATAANADSA